MQGLPRINMIPLDLKESSENPDLSPLYKYIEIHYNENSDNYKDSFKEFLNLRQLSVSSSENLNSLTTMKRYYCQLQLLKARFPIISNENCGVNWHWEDSTSNTTISLADIRFEEASIMYNIACLHCNLGAKEPRVDLDSTKVACTHFQCATWAFQAILDKYTPLAIADLECDLLRFLNLLMMAQAHECVLEKSMVDQRRAAITAKIAFQISDFYKQCQGLLRSENIGYAVNSRYYKIWKRTCAFKEQLYYCLSCYYMALTAEESNKYGDIVAWMKLSKEKLEKCMKPLKELKSNKAEETIKFVQDVVNGKLESCIKDNNFIYYEKVPESDMLPPIKGAMLLKGIPFDVNDPDICGKDIFRNLIPMETHFSSSIYSEKKAEILRHIQEDVNEKNEEIQKFLNDMQWDDSNLSLTDMKAPQELFSCAAFVSANLDVLKTIKNTMQDISNISIEVEESLGTLSNEMRKIKSDKNLSSWKLLEQDYTELINNFEDAKESNYQLREAFDCTLKDFEFVKGPIEKVIDCLPSVREFAETESTKAYINECKRLLDKVEEMTKQRMDLLQQLREQMMNDDLTQYLLNSTDESERNKIINEGLKKHNELIDYLRQNMSAQANIMNAIVEHNAKIADIKMKLLEVKKERESVVSRIIRSFNSYNNILKKGEEGIVFYQKLSHRVLKLQKDVDKLISHQNALVEPVIAKVPQSNQLLTYQTNDASSKTLTSKSEPTFIHQMQSLQPSVNQPLRLKDYLKERKSEKSATVSPKIFQDSFYDSGISTTLYQYIPWGFYGPPSGQSTYTANYSVSKSKAQDSEFRITQNIYLPTPASEVGTDHSVYSNYSSLPRTNYSTYSQHFNNSVSSAASSDNLTSNPGFTIPYQHNSFNNPNIISMAHGFCQTATSVSENKSTINEFERSHYCSYPYIHDIRDSQYFSQFQNAYTNSGYVNNMQHAPNNFVSYASRPQHAQIEQHYSNIKGPTQDFPETNYVVQNDQNIYTSNYSSNSQNIPQNEYIESRDSPFQPNVSQYHSNNGSLSHYQTNQCSIPTVSERFINTSVSYNIQDNFQPKTLDFTSQNNETFPKPIQNVQKQLIEKQNYSQIFTDKPFCSMLSVRSDKKINMTDLLSSSPTNDCNPDNSGAVLEPKILTKQEIEDQKEEKRKQSYHKQHSGSKHPLNDHLALNKFIADAERFLKKLNDCNDNVVFEKHWNQLVSKERNFVKKSTAIAKCSPMKNRMQDSVPYDENRVVIKDGKDDYINASHILLQNIDECFPRFLTCQSPLFNTVSEFWTAIFEQGCEILVQLACVCNGDDTSKGRVVSYWPDPKSKSITIGSKFEISVQSFKEKPNWNERILLIKHLKTNQSRSVWHFQVHNVTNKLPKSLDEFLTFETELCRYYRQQRSLTKPIGVTCINGSSVCGVLILLTASLLQMEITGIFPDIDNILLTMWQQRKNLLDDKHQLLFVYKAISKASCDLLSKRNIVIGPGRIANSTHNVVSEHSSHLSIISSVSQNNQTGSSTNSIIDSIFTNQHLQLSDLDSVLSKWTVKTEEYLEENIKVNDKNVSIVVPQESNMLDQKVSVSNKPPVDIQLPSTLSHLQNPSAIDFTPTPAEKRKMTKKEFEAKLNNTFIQPSSNIDSFDSLKALDPIHKH